MLKDRIRGSLIGGAIGDALGYPVEFISSFEGIQARYGEKGITRFDLKPDWLDEREWTGKAIVSDDTQMTLFTANGLLNAVEKQMPILEGIKRAYIEWLFTQTDMDSPEYKDCWLRTVPELHNRRAPGNTCLTALVTTYQGGIPSNNSKGCGGVMRIAPIPLYAAVDNRMAIEEADKLAGDASELTHLHPLGFIPSALMAHVIFRLATDAQPTREKMADYIREGVDVIRKMYEQFDLHVDYMEELAELAIELAHNDATDLQNLSELGEGWVGEEALAVALYCAMRYIDDFEAAMIASVNHGGDSDSTGAVTGNILGAALGYEAIPQFYKDDLEMHDLILHMADDLFDGKISQ